MTLSSPRVVLPDGVRSATLRIAGGRIESVEPGPREDASSGSEPDHVLLPGIVDSHVHVNEPGHADWEGFTTAGNSAAAGGVTTFVDMPLNSLPVTTSVAALHAKRDAAQAAGCRADYGFWGGVIPGNAGELRALRDAGVLGYKAFLSPSGLPEFPNVGEADLREAMPVLADLDAPLLVHAEDPAFLEDNVATSNPSRSYAHWLASRPPIAEVRAIELVARLAAKYGTRVHIVHVASADAADAVRRAKDDGVRITAETCPHYLTFTADEIPDGDPRFKCAPPIREASHREALWAALADGTLDLIATDHSPCPPAVKCLDTGDVAAAWGGITSLQLALSAVWMEASARGHSLSDVARWMCERPAELAGLTERKGALVAGRDADIVVFCPDETFEVQGSMLRHRHPSTTPWIGRRLRGVVKRTLVRGRVTYDDGALVNGGFGIWLT